MVEVAVEFYILRLVSSIELARAVRDPGPCARASCEPVALLLSKSINLHTTTLQRNTKRRFALQRSHFTLHSSHSALHTAHVAA